MAIMLPNKDKKQAIKQIRETGSLIVEKRIYLDNMDNVIDLDALRKSDSDLKLYKKVAKYSVLVLALSSIVGALWMI